MRKLRTINTVTVMLALSSAGVPIHRSLAATQPGNRQIFVLTATDKAVDVRHLRDNYGSRGVTFIIKVRPFSYRYINGYRNKAISSGYVLCTKSAISKWSVLPAHNVASRKAGSYWLFEMYKSTTGHSYIELRVDQDVNQYGRYDRQRFAVMELTIPAAAVAASNVGEFCDG